MKFIIATVVCFAALAAQAQVNRCLDPGGRVSYSDGPCPSSAKASRVEAQKSTEAIELERERAQLARERFQLQQERQAVKRERSAEPAPQVVQPVSRVDSHQCDIAKRNLGAGISPESKMQSQRAYEVACFGDKAADIEQARAAAEAEAKARRRHRIIIINR